MQNRHLSNSRIAAGLFAVALIFTWLAAGAASGVIVVPPPGLNPLNQTPVPEPPQLFFYVKNKSAAIQLGKAFYWEMQAGSDGTVACATCHFSAGVDRRLKNTLNPGTRSRDTRFGNNSLNGVPGFPQFKPNYTLDPVNDFPLHRRGGVGHLQTDPIVQDTNDVVGSQGVRLSDFVGVGVLQDPSVDSIPASEVDPVFHDPTYGNLRQVTGRNTPTVINAVFHFTNFWDGRANFRFNGENPFGPADPDAGVWFDDPAQQRLVKRPVVIEFASLASQATGPPMDTVEMSGRGRTFPMLGRKLLGLTPLGKQLVSHDDSELGGLAKSAVTRGAKGLHTGYAQLIENAFVDNLWNSPKLTPEGYTQMEANFSLFWGLAIQLYEATLVSGDSPFDRWLGGDSNAMTEHQQFGFSIFSGVGNCNGCHVGTELTDHSVAAIAFLDNAINNTMALMFAADGQQKIYDEGFTNNAVRPTADDIGRGGNTPFPNQFNGDQPIPLAFSSLAILQELGLLPFSTMILKPIIPVDMPVNTDGAFKVPSLRNVELTPPYFHNGSVTTLDEALNFYSRGGNFPALNLQHLDPIIGAGLTLISNNQPLHEALTDFLTALTDPRVEQESAPFDHPELFIPEGDPEVLRHIPARSSDGSVFMAALSLNPVISPTTIPTQTISGTIESGAIPEIMVDTAATIGLVTVTGTTWSCEISGFVEGSNGITVSAVIGGTLMSVTATIDFIAPPVAGDDIVTTKLNAPVVIQVLANDSDPYGALNPASVAIATFPAMGWMLVNPATGAVTYTPKPNFVGKDSFTYTVSNSSGVVSNAATVRVTTSGISERIVVKTARYNIGLARWEIVGHVKRENRLVRGRTLIFRVGPNFTGRIIGAATTDASGTFTFLAKSRIAVPDATKTISIQSSNGTLRLRVPVTVRKFNRKERD
jgi:cytochrome c peroxidase